ncbi:MAG: hypothetical protein IT223_01435 [Crocinitomicaceae bacterium]|nr:hypothetical protein [Crocinitomicaceae bacterium]
MLTKQIIEKYFFEEKQSGLFFLMIGIAAIAISLVLYFYLKTSAWRGMAIPLFAIGIFQGIAGYSVFSRSDRQRVDIVYAHDMNPALIKNKEIPRMEKRMRGFIVFRYVEILLMAAGLFLFFFFRNNTEWSFWWGIGITLFIQLLIIILVGYFAEHRGQEYLHALRSYCSQ